MNGEIGSKLCQKIGRDHVLSKIESHKGLKKRDLKVEFKKMVTCNCCKLLKRTYGYEKSYLCWSTTCSLSYFN